MYMPRFRLRMPSMTDTLRMSSRISTRILTRMNAGFDSVANRVVFSIV